jgi:regulation of enolase protein 1 (concanavalin A-like superfamily)
MELDRAYIPGLPAPLHWQNEPLDWRVTAEGTLQITAGPKTDWFLDPQGAVEAANAPALLFASDGPAMLHAYVRVAHAATYDAGVLVVYQGPRSWAKLCLEQSPQGEPMIVSVVTKGFSDDSNAYLVPSGVAYLRVARLERAFAFHASRDGSCWNMIRYFVLDPAAPVELGFLSQSPTGERCTATFVQIHYAPHLLADIRSGE